MFRAIHCIHSIGAVQVKYNDKALIKKLWMQLVILLVEHWEYMVMHMLMVGKGDNTLIIENVYVSSGVQYIYMLVVEHCEYMEQLVTSTGSALGVHCCAQFAAI